ncbi:bifunctional diguanylate cyclase/phosphodiesterase [Motiliproteus sp. SC1-56]|uniref:EAL domain-containing response regulator n=1 Tax=Motiliproteus sp. SC1-56 TaxID=2799565 RepID=UPI001A8ED8B4|nr:bifunctional diguanylate cyclase/phosphodiesterase [Motiliproteus sp. SC1-56]
MQKLRQNLNILFIGVKSTDSEPVISLLQAERLSAHAEQVDTAEQLNKALGARTWDLILIAQQAPLSLAELGEQLKAHNKDIPVIVLAPTADVEHRLEGMKNRASAVVPFDQKELLTLVIRRELYHLKNRRRRRQAEFHLVESEKRLRELLHSSSEAIAFVNKEHELIYLNPAFMEMTGFEDSKELLGSPLEQLADGEEKQKLSQGLDDFRSDSDVEQDLDLLIRRKDNSRFNASLNLHRSRFERTACIQVTMHTPHQDAVMESLAEQDLVTGLKNQVFLAKKLDQAVQSAVRAGQGLHLFYITLDNFNSLKAEVGVNGADTIVRDVANTLKKLVNRAHVLTRYNLDAFALIYGDPDSSKAMEVAERIRAAVESNLSTVAGQSIQTTCSIGVTPITADSPSSQEVLRLAQAASEGVSSESQRGNGVNLLVPEEQEEDEGLSVKKLRAAIKDNSFKLLFQPVVSLRGDHQSLYEVLLRLIDKDDNEVSPNMFLTMLDHAELSVELDRWVIQESIRQLAEEHREGKRNRLFINLTGRSLEDPRLLQWIAEQLKAFEVPGDSLIFQFSEADASSYLKYANIFAQGLVQLHASACIKHYGSSIDSENVLRHVPAEYVKLDGSFVQELEDPAKHEAFDKLIEPLRLGEKTVVAPLVEGTNVMTKLYRAGVHYIQGYYLQAPRSRMDYDFFSGA